MLELNGHTPIDLQQVQIPVGWKASRLNCLILSDTDIPNQVAQDYTNSLSQLFSEGHYQVVNCREPHHVRSIDLSNCDIVLVNYTIHLAFQTYLPPILRKAIKSFDGLKVAVIQDEYQWIDKTAWNISELGIDAIISSLSCEIIPRVYRHPELKSVFKISALPGYVPAYLLEMQSQFCHDKRPTDIFYRTRELPYLLGSVGREKYAIAKGSVELCMKYGLTADIGFSESDRLYGDAWFAAMRRSKAVLGTEGGSSIFDFTDEVAQRYELMMADNPATTYEEAMSGWLGQLDGNIVHRTVTPRCFEAIAMGCALIMFEGTYRGILSPYKHYFPLASDFSNFSDLAIFLRDPDRINQMTELAHNDLIASKKYSTASFSKKLSFILQSIYDKKLKYRKSKIRTIKRFLGFGNKSKFADCV